MSKAVNSKWKKTFPDTIGNQNRPATGVDDTQPFETGAFPQYIANDPVRYDLQNAAMSQLMSNDARLKEMVNARGKELDDHNVDPGAHKTGIAGNAATATKVVTTAATGASANIAEASMGGSDSARIRVSGAENAGELALETTDNGDEAIVARQYTGVYEKVARTASILDKNGNTSFPGTVVAPNFTGALSGNAATATRLQTPRTLSLTGKAAGSTTFDGSANASINVTSINADTATKATQDGAGKVITNTYLKKAGDTATGDLTAPNFIGHLKGNADTATRAATADNAEKLGGYALNTEGTGGYFGTIPKVGTDGVMEVGKYIDWHSQNGGSADYTSRWEAQNNGTVTVGTINGTLNGNAATATNADTVDGYHASDLLRTLGGNRTPVITDIFDRAGTIDMSTMSAADKATHKANINKAENVIQDLWNNSTGIHAYNGDLDMNGYSSGALKLTQSYKNFDKILVVFTTDYADYTAYCMWDVWELAHALANSYCLNLSTDADIQWNVYGTAKHGTITNYAVSTDTIWNTQDQNCGLVAIYGIKY